jgi:hypothetical protein
VGGRGGTAQKYVSQCKLLKTILVCSVLKRKGKKEQKWLFSASSLPVELENCVWEMWFKKKKA